MHIHKVECSQIVETWSSGDGPGVLRQLGALPPTGPSPRTPVHEAASSVAFPASDCPPGAPEENAAIATHWTEKLDRHAVVRWTGRGANDGDFHGNPPTGIAVTFTDINSYRIACGQMAEGWSDVDSLQPLQQLGLVPEVFPGPATPTS